jgi:L-aminopeptidase/D-esterase-like protein
VGVVATNARLTKVACMTVAQGGHDGLARAISPAHTRVDGDALVAAATGALDEDVPVDLVRHLAVAAVEAAVLAGAP